jgi:transcriptional regulator GlxA family with amidase domain
MGRTIHQEIARTRIARARRLLSDSTLTMEKVAAGSGFSAVQRFHSEFRRAEGMSPGQWRSRQGKR